MERADIHSHEKESVWWWAAVAEEPGCGFWNISCPWRWLLLPPPLASKMAVPTGSPPIPPTSLNCKFGMKKEAEAGCTMGLKPISRVSAGCDDRRERARSELIAWFNSSENIFRLLDASRSGWQREPLPGCDEVVVCKNEKCFSPLWWLSDENPGNKLFPPLKFINFTSLSTFRTPIQECIWGLPIGKYRVPAPHSSSTSKH